jgi:glyoxylase-like metal-dependent hydrolase (beta-lactamase superfamily II)
MGHDIAPPQRVHDPAGSARPRRMLTRRTLLWDLGAAVGVLALAACTTGEGATTAAAANGDPPRTSDPDEDGPSTETAGTPTRSETQGSGLRWERVVGGVSAAYVLVRRGEATIVDTGQAGTELGIQDGLAALGLGWEAVSTVLLTHKHPDHVGSLGEVAARAAAARLLAGRGDIDAFPAPRPVEPVGNGDTVMDLQVVETPGHTPGHVSVFDPTARVLVAGDALNGTNDDGVAGPNPDFSEDMATAWTSAGALAHLRPDVILFGHGPPATRDAADALDAVVAEGG